MNAQHKKIENLCSSSLWKCLHHLIILRSQNKIIDFFMILAWTSPLNMLNIGLCPIVPSNPPPPPPPLDTLVDGKDPSWLSLYCRPTTMSINMAYEAMFVCLFVCLFGLASPHAGCPGLPIIIDRSQSRLYSQIHIKFINQDYWISRISQSILNQFSWNFTHTIFDSCRNYPENFAKFW